MVVPARMRIADVGLVELVQLHVAIIMNADACGMCMFPWFVATTCFDFPPRPVPIMYSISILPQGSHAADIARLMVITVFNVNVNVDNLLTM